MYVHVCQVIHLRLRLWRHAIGHPRLLQCGQVECWGWRWILESRYLQQNRRHTYVHVRRYTSVTHVYIITKQ